MGGYVFALFFLSFPVILMLFVCVQCIRMVISRRYRCSWNILKISNASLGILQKRYNSSIHLSNLHLPSYDQILASASYDDTIKLYIDDPSDDWFTFATLTEHASTVWGLARSPAFPNPKSNSSSGPNADDPGRSHSYLASCSQDCSVRIWQRTAQHKWECVPVLGGHERSVYSVSWGRGVRPLSSEVEGKREREKGYLGWLASAGGSWCLFGCFGRFSLLQFWRSMEIKYMCFTFLKGLKGICCP